MQIFFLCKRRPQHRDLIIRPYGRFFYLPKLFAAAGFDVKIILLSYKKEKSENFIRDGIEWHAESIFPARTSPSPFSYIKKIDFLIYQNRPDWIVSFSDISYGILAQYFGTRYQICTLIDAYDNYESYMPWAKPLHWAWRRALKKASLVTAAGPELANLMHKNRTGQKTLIVPMAADPIFCPMDRLFCRHSMELPENIPLVGYSGSLYKSRNLSYFFDVIRKLSVMLPDVKFVISGRRQKGVSLPADIKSNIIEKGYISDHDIPKLINSMDAMISINKPSDFGEYSYPVKIYEAMQCQVPIVATAVGGSKWILRDHPECLAEHDNACEMTAKIYEILSNNISINYKNSSWEQSFQIMLDGISTD